MARIPCCPPLLARHAGLVIRVYGHRFLRVYLERQLTQMITGKEFDKLQLVKWSSYRPRIGEHLGRCTEVVLPAV